MSIPGCGYELEKYMMLVRELWKRENQDEDELITIILYLNEEPF